MSIPPITSITSSARTADPGLPPHLRVQAGAHGVHDAAFTRWLAPSAGTAAPLVAPTASAEDAATIAQLLRRLGGSPTGAWLLAEARRLGGSIELASREQLQRPGIDRAALGSYATSRGVASVHRELAEGSPDRAALVLAHELQHLHDARTGRGVDSLRAEARANVAESLVARELGSADISIFAGQPLEPLDMAGAMRRLGDSEGYRFVPSESRAALPHPQERTVADVAPTGAAHLAALGVLAVPAPAASWSAPVPALPLDRAYGSGNCGPITGASPMRRIATAYEPIEAHDDARTGGGQAGDGAAGEQGTGDERENGGPYRSRSSIT